MKEDSVDARESKRATTTGDRLEGMEPRAKIWIERHGRVALSDWRVALLEGIGRTGSLAKAAEDLGVPYRSAWQRLKESEECLGIRLIESQSGGADGGSSQLTQAARELLGRYHQFRAGIAGLVDQRFEEAFVQKPLK